MLLDKLSLKNELDDFLAYLCTKLNVSSQQMNDLVRDYNPTLTTSCSAKSSNINLNITPPPQRGEPQRNKVASPSQQIVITKDGERFKTSTPDSLLKTITNPPLLKLLKRQTLSGDELNFLKQFLTSQNIPFSESTTSTSPPVKKLTNIQAIVDKVQHEVEESKKLKESDKTIKRDPIKRDQPKTKLKLVKIGKDEAWDRESHYVFKLDKPPVVIGYRKNKDDKTSDLTQKHITELNQMGWKFTASQ